MSERFVVRRRILFGDCDPGGIVYTPRFAHFAVEAGLDFLGQRLGAPVERTLFELGVGPPARAFSMEFLRMLRWDDELELEVSVAAVGTTSFTLEIEGRHLGETAFRARITQVCVNMQDQRAVEMPERLRRALT